MAAAAHTACAGDAKCQRTEYIIKQFDAAAASGAEICQPEPKEPIVKARKTLRRDRPWAFFRLLQKSQTRRELHIREIQLYDPLPNLLRVAGKRVRQRTEHIKRDVVLSQQGDRSFHALHGRCAGGVHPCGVVLRCKQVVRDADQKLMLLQEQAPRLVQMHGIRLQRIADRDPRRPAVRDLGQRTEKVQPCEHRFSALKHQRDMVARRDAARNVFHDPPQDAVLHHTKGADAAPRCDIGVKAVAAPEIAQRRSRFEHDRIIFHSILPGVCPTGAGVPSA